MNRFLYLIVIILLIPILIGRLFAFERYSSNNKTEPEQMVTVWARGFIVFLGIFGLFWQNNSIVNIVISNRLLVSAITIIIALACYYLKIKSTNNMYSKKQMISWKTRFILVFLLFFGLCIVEDTAYIYDVSNDMSSGIGKSLYSFVANFTDMKQEKMVLYLFPLVFIFISYEVLVSINNMLGLNYNNNGYASLFLLAFLFFPLWKPEFKSYNIFGKGYETGTIFACLVAPIFFMWLIYIIKMISNKSFSLKIIILLSFYLIIIFGIFNLLQVFKYPLAETPLSNDFITEKLKEPNNWMEAIRTTRLSLSIFGIGRYNFAMVLFCMFILLYLRDYKKSSMLLGINILIVLIFLPPLTLYIVKTYGLYIYTGLLNIIPLPLICTYTYARIEERIDDKRKKRLLLMFAFIILIFCCYYNCDIWETPRELMG